MAGALKGQTTNYSFNLINFDYPRWHTYDWDNWSAADTALKALDTRTGVSEGKIANLFNSPPINGYPKPSRVIDVRGAPYLVDDVTPGANYTSKVQWALNDATDDCVIILPSVPWLCDGLILPQKRNVTINAPGPIIFSGIAATTLMRTNPTTGIVYEPALLTQFGNAASVTINGSILDGWNLGAHGINQSGGAFCVFNFSAIRFVKDGIHLSVHETNCANCTYNIPLIEFCFNGAVLSSDDLYAADPTKYLYMNPTHMCEAAKLNINFITYAMYGGIVRKPRLKRTVAHPVNAGQFIHYVSGTVSFGAVGVTIDACSYYNMDGGVLGGFAADPPNAAPNLYANRYNGPTPIANALSTAPVYYPGFTRPNGILTKPPTAAGSRDNIDDFAGTFTIPVNDWFNGSQVTGSPLVLSWSSDVMLVLEWNGNTYDFLRTNSAGMKTGFTLSPYQQRMSLGNLNFNGNTGTISRDDGQYAVFIPGAVALGVTSGVTANFGTFNGATATTAQVAARVFAIEEIIRSLLLMYRV